MNEFKAGDLVYSPTEGSQVFEVVRRNNVNTYQIGVGKQTFTENGMAFAGQIQPSIFHATKENQAKIEALYGVKFDDPPLSDAERVIKALEKANGKPVLCWVKTQTGCWIMRDVVSYSEQHGFAMSGHRSGYKGYDEVKPVDPDDFVLV